ncbi:MAG: RNA 3'-terminal phosphate cyclase [Candidatus Hadarchaeales archaeon]
MIEIDGSMGEGGGAVLRVATALSAVSRRPVRIYNIRVKRDNPGLQHQHLSGVEALASLSGAKVRGAELGSTELTFEPGRIRGGKHRVDIGTAGSTTLVLQVLMIASAFAERSVEVEIRGGTDNPRAPPVDYVKNVMLPIIGRMGYRVEVSCLRRGHYPRGGGVITAKMEPVRMLRALKMTERGRVVRISGLSHSVRLPDDVSRRIAHAAGIALLKAGYSNVSIRSESHPQFDDVHLGPGAGITLWAETERGGLLGANALGAPGKPSEKVGREAADELVSALGTGCAIDRYMADQLVPYMAIAEGTSEVTCSELTRHTLTNIRLVETVIGVKFDVEGKIGVSGRIRVTGAGLTNDPENSKPKEYQQNYEGDMNR